MPWITSSTPFISCSHLFKLNPEPYPTQLTNPTSNSTQSEYSWSSTREPTQNTAARAHYQAKRVQMTRGPTQRTALEQSILNQANPILAFMHRRRLPYPTKNWHVPVALLLIDNILSVGPARFVLKPESDPRTRKSPTHARFDPEWLEITYLTNSPAPFGKLAIDNTGVRLSSSFLSEGSNH